MTFGSLGANHKDLKFLNLRDLSLSHSFAVRTDTPTLMFQFKGQGFLRARKICLLWGDLEVSVGLILLPRANAALAVG
jgi:hypothetical protein